MNPHKILKNTGYATRDDYPDIARAAAAFVKKQKTSKNELLAEIERQFGKPPDFETMTGQPLDYPVYGEPVNDRGEGDIDRGAIRQMNTVMRLPVAKAGALMPDAHVGYAMPIGGVAALHEAVSPSFVGYDIACRVTLSILDIFPGEFENYRAKIADDMRAVSSFGLNSGFADGNQREHEVMDDPLWKELNVVRNLKDKAAGQLGSSGGGNHFFDALIGECIEDVEWLPVKKGEPFVAIMTHSGSRGTGHRLATHFVKLAAKETKARARNIPNGYEWLDTNSDAGREYLAVMNLMGRYAQANHHLIHDHFVNRSGIGSLYRCENHHNFAWVMDDGAVVHRKGATPAEKGQVGLIPGTSGTSSYLVEGLGEERSLKSSAHGAGRPFSRTEAKRRHDDHRFQEHMNTNDILHFGLAPDETMMAYKDIERVMSLQTELVRPIARMYPRVVIMGGKSDDGD